MPHDVVPFMEFDHAQFSTNRHLGIPLLATHLPYSFLPRSIIDSGTPKIHLFYRIISLQGTVSPEILNPFNLMKLLNRFMKVQVRMGLIGTMFWGTGKQVWDIQIELVEDTVLYLKKIAEFMGYPFSSEEQEQGVPENIVQLCSFKNISSLEVNKTGKHREGKGNLGTESNIFFRKGKVGDWKNYLITKMAQCLDQRTMQKLSGSGLSL
ncbi:hypothetical protein J1N35_028153 [Gossypium stocksii]|uniref:Sulfotransferase n=1 Tax=Gossypium stocksii TaxID=47602 RepID=A0A9D3UVD2_9ROSI|nr:hypothetical protein J1N35_028153 [Gossypium stocksii]